MSLPGPIDRLLARAMRSDAAVPVNVDPDVVAERALYHGIAGFLTGPAVMDWPAALRNHLHQQALSQAMWEMRHKIVLNSFLDALSSAGIAVVVLKGTAMAYCYYANPATRARGDSDLLIAPVSLDCARQVLRDQGFKPFYAEDASPDERKQEPWTIHLPDGSRHEIDLHWSALNTPVLDEIMPVDKMLSQAVPLPALGAAGLMLPPHLALLHACLHRAKHVTSPYFVDGVVHYGGDRLIWLKDIDLMARALDPSEQIAFEAAVAKGGVGQICAQALQTSQALLETPLLSGVIERLGNMPVGPAGLYLAQTHPGHRALHELKAVDGGIGGKLHYIFKSMFPPADFMRAKYADLAHRPLAWLYLRRIFGLWRPRPGQRR